MTENGDDTSMDWNDALDQQKEEEYAVEDLVEWLAQREDNEFAQSLVAFYDDKGYLSPSQLDKARAMRDLETDPVIEPGMYRTPDGTVYWVRRAQKGHLYALSPHGEDWDLARGAMRELRGSMKVSDKETDKT